MPSEPGTITNESWNSPSAVEAKLVVGAHNYVVGSLPWGVKVAASMVGLGGNKEKGLQYLKECAQGEGETSVDAQILLVLFLRANTDMTKPYRLLAP